MCQRYAREDERTESRRNAVLVANNGDSLQAFYPQAPLAPGYHSGFCTNLF
jgi:hypothetical protein